MVRRKYVLAFFGALLAGAMATGGALASVPRVILAEDFGYPT